MNPRSTEPTRKALDAGQPGPVDLRRSIRGCRVVFIREACRAATEPDRYDQRDRGEGVDTDALSCGDFGRVQRSLRMDDLAFRDRPQNNVGVVRASPSASVYSARDPSRPRGRRPASTPEREWPSAHRRRARCARAAARGAAMVSRGARRVRARRMRGCRPSVHHRVHAQQNFHLLPQLTHVTKVVIGSSADLVCSW